MSENSKKTIRRRRSGKKKCRPRGRGFRPGESGNPKGRPKLTQEDRDARDLARGKCVRAVEILGEIMESPIVKPADRVRACCEILDRGLGRAPQALEIGGKEGSPPIKIETRNEPRPEDVAPALEILHRAGLLASFMAAPVAPLIGGNGNGNGNGKH